MSLTRHSSPSTMHEQPASSATAFSTPCEPPQRGDEGRPRPSSCPPAAATTPIHLVRPSSSLSVQTHLIQTPQHRVAPVLMPAESPSRTPLSRTSSEPLPHSIPGTPVGCKATTNVGEAGSTQQTHGGERGFTRGSSQVRGTNGEGHEAWWTWNSM
jgi:hypothetical protein